MRDPIHIIRTFSIVVIATLCYLMSVGDAQRENMALGKLASQSSKATAQAMARKAVDGVKETDSNVHPCAHTKKGTLTWWGVNLLQPIIITAIEITNRDGDAGLLLKNFSVEISRVDPFSLQGFPGETSSPVCLNRGPPIHSAASVYFHCDKPIFGQYVRVVKYSDPPGSLIICEFEVYGPPDSWTLERQFYEPHGLAEVLEIVPGRPTILECGRFCVRNSGQQCKYIQINPSSGTCRLLKGFLTNQVKETSDWNLYKVIR